jgi:8-oxo-dGTP diphosphatase
MSQGADSVRVVVIDPDTHKFLLVTEADDLGNWKLPGGKFEAKEMPNEAAVRELSEELGLIENDYSLGAHIELLNNDGISKRFIYKVLASQKGIHPSDEIAKTMWTTIDKIPECKNALHIRTAVTSVDV